MFQRTNAITNFKIQVCECGWKEIQWIRHLPHAKNSGVKKTTEKAWLAGLNLVPICWAMPT